MVYSFEILPILPRHTDTGYRTSTTGTKRDDATTQRAIQQLTRTGSHSIAVSEAQLSVTNRNDRRSGRESPLQAHSSQIGPYATEGVNPQMHRRKRKNGKNGKFASVRPYAENVGAMAGQAAERVGPMVESAGQRLSGAMSEAAVASEPYRREAALRGRAAWAALCGADPRKVRRRGRNRRLVLFGGLAVLSVGAGVAYWMIRTAPPSAWHPNASDDITAPNRDADAAAGEDSELSERQRTSGTPGSGASGTEHSRPSSPPKQRASSTEAKSSGSNTKR